MLALEISFIESYRLSRMLALKMSFIETTCSLDALVVSLSFNVSHFSRREKK